MLVVAAFEARKRDQNHLHGETFNSSRMNRIALVELAGAFLITQADFMQRLLGTTQLSPRQWGIALSRRRRPARLVGGRQVDRPPKDEDHAGPCRRSWVTIDHFMPDHVAPHQDPSEVDDNGHQGA